MRLKSDVIEAAHARFEKLLYQALVSYRIKTKSLLYALIYISKLGSFFLLRNGSTKNIFNQ